MLRFSSFARRARIYSASFRLEGVKVKSSGGNALKHKVRGRAQILTFCANPRCRDDETIDEFSREATRMTNNSGIDDINNC